MLSVLSTIVLVGAAIVVGLAIGSRDKARVAASLRDVPGEIVSISFRGTGAKGRARIYRVVSQLPEGGRLLHRVAIHQDGSIDRLL